MRVGDCIVFVDPFSAQLALQRCLWDHPFAPWSIFPTHFSTALFTTAHVQASQLRCHSNQGSQIHFVSS